MVNAELQTRAITGSIIAVCFCGVLYAGELPLNIALLLIAMVLALEWDRLSASLPRILKIVALPYMALALGCAAHLRAMPNGIEYLIFVVACVCATDIFAYFGGKRFGRIKLAPSISPKKTVEGLASGVLMSLITGAILSGMAGYPFSLLSGALLGCMIACGAQVGDLLESWVKRQAGAKDSGTILPGHGGLLDRLDGYFVALPLFTLLLHLYGGSAG